MNPVHAGPKRRPRPRRRIFGGPESLHRRLLVAAGIFLGVALIVAGLSIGFILHRFVRGQIDGRLDDRVRALASDLRTDRGGPVSLGGDRDGPPFDRPRSGWYWQIRHGATVIGSASLEGRRLDLPAAAPREMPNGASSPADGTGPWGESLILRSLTLSGEPSTVIAASAPAAALRGPILEALRILALCLSLIGLFLFAGVLFQIRLGLRPLRHLRDQLAEVREGRIARLPARQPAEIRPLVTEMNALLDQNAANLAHARAHVANLAHGLKTPLATLSVALADAAADRDGNLRHLVGSMDRRIRHHLRRARSAATGGTTRTRVDLATHLDDLRIALSRIHADKEIRFTFTVPEGMGIACDPQDLDEILGNLIENACHWCRGAVRVEARREEAIVVVRIEDDGPGLAAEAIEAVLQRGRRLDESQPGYGFGLPIAVELAELYGGALTLQTSSDLGGLRVDLTLPV